MIYTSLSRNMNPILIIHYLYVLHVIPNHHHIFNPKLWGHLLDVKVWHSTHEMQWWSQLKVSFVQSSSKIDHWHYIKYPYGIFVRVIQCLITITSIHTPIQVSHILACEINHLPQSRSYLDCSNKKKINQSRSNLDWL